MSNIPIIGIDLGTCNSSVAIFQNGKVEILPNDFDEKTTPSYVAFTETQKLVGNIAKNQMKSNLSNTIFGIKRLIGCSFNDKEIQKDIQKFPFNVIRISPKLKLPIKMRKNSFILRKY